MTTKKDYLKIISDLREIYINQISQAQLENNTEDKEYYALLGGKRANEIIEENINALINENKNTVFVLTHKRDNMSFPPQVFTDKQKALTNLNNYKELFDIEKEMGIVHHYFERGECGLTVVFTDCTRSEYDIFEVEIQ